MGRRINTTSYQATGGAESTDNYAARIVKLIPADVVAGWLAVTSAIRSAHQPPGVAALWIIFGIGVIFAAAWTWKQTGEPTKPKPVTQTIVSTCAFCVWAYATGGPLPQWPGSLYNPLYATLSLVFFTLASGLVPMP